jgi:hypothetical protein
MGGRDLVGRILDARYGRRVLKMGYGRGDAVAALEICSLHMRYGSRYMRYGRLHMR